MGKIRTSKTPMRVGLQAGNFYLWINYLALRSLRRAQEIGIGFKANRTAFRDLTLYDLEFSLCGIELVASYKKYKK